MKLILSLMLLMPFAAQAQTSDNPLDVAHKYITTQFDTFVDYARFNSSISAIAQEAFDVCYNATGRITLEEVKALLDEASKKSSGYCGISSTEIFDNASEAGIRMFDGEDSRVLKIKFSNRPNSKSEPNLVIRESAPLCVQRSGDTVRIAYYFHLQNPGVLLSLKLEAPLKASGEIAPQVQEMSRYGVIELKNGRIEDVTHVYGYARYNWGGFQDWQKATYSCNAND